MSILSTNINYYETNFLCSLLNRPADVEDLSCHSRFSCFSIYEDNIYDRVVSMQLPCEDNPGLYCDMDMGKNYSVATVSFLANGGSKFQK